jgi:DNA-binding transcriptional ArsR family regulator
MSRNGEDPRVWKALGSPHRRALLDALRDGAKTTMDLCEVLPQLSRFAVMQHLAVLERAGVVIVRRNGRERWNELNAVPIQRELERWLNSFRRATASELVAFERHLHASAPSRKEE